MRYNFFMGVNEMRVNITVTVSVRVSVTVRVSCIFLIWAGADGAASVVFLQPPALRNHNLRGRANLLQRLLQLFVQCSHCSCCTKWPLLCINSEFDAFLTRKLLYVEHLFIHLTFFFSRFRNIYNSSKMENFIILFCRILFTCALYTLD